MPPSPLSLRLAFVTLFSSLISANASADSTPPRHSFNDTEFTLDACQLGTDRVVVCRMTLLNRFTDKRIEISRGVTIQDDLGNEYPVTSGGFGDTPKAARWNQIAVADSQYTVQVVAPNISSKAAAVRAVVFPRLLVRSMQGTALGYRDRVVFARPPMQQTAPTEQPATAPPPAAAKRDNPEPASADLLPGAADSMPVASDEWQVVGLWSYDAEDGQHIPAQGYVLRARPGAGVGQAWLAHLELKNHADLPKRQRALWPVMLHVEKRRVCADYPDYPTYRVFIDLPGIDHDAIYAVSKCQPE